MDVGSGCILVFSLSIHSVQGYVCSVLNEEWYATTALEFIVYLDSTRGYAAEPFKGSSVHRLYNSVQHAV